MRIEWLAKKGSRRVVCFFNGWGMDANVVANLSGEVDIVMFYDYRDLTCEPFTATQDYEEVYIVAWSMGVWAASCVIPKLKIQPVLSVALNGTERPVDDCDGIPVKVYELTEKGMDERGREKFFSRMFASKEESQFLSSKKSIRDLPELCEELSLIKRQSIGCQSFHHWDKIYISGQDVIFPVKNQLNWWKDKAPVTMITGGHYPFSGFKSWEEIIGI